MTKHEYNRGVALGSFLAILAIVLLMAFVTHCSAVPKPCPREGTLQLEYMAKLQEVCDGLDEVECERERPKEMAAARDEYRAQFEELNRCRQQ